MTEPRNLSVREAREYFLDDCRTDSTDWTVQTYRYRTKRFLHWCENENVERVGDLSGWDIEQFKRARQADDIAPATLKGSMMTLKQFIDYCARIDAVDVDLSEKAGHAVPELSSEDATSDVKLSTEDAKALITFYRNSTAHYGRRKHAVFEVFWNTGARLSGLRALDLGDYNQDDRFLDFVNRPSTGTRLKNGEGGQRPVKISPAVCEVLDFYVERERCEKRDESGRRPLFSSRQGRASDASIRAWCYLATQPCVRTQCPHGKHEDTCSYRRRNHASKCPSSRAPHQIRTGSITWHRDMGVPMEVTAERVNASPKIIERFYDKASRIERMEQRRQPHTEDLDVLNDG